MNIIATNHWKWVKCLKSRHGAIAIWHNGYAFAINKYVTCQSNRTIHAEINVIGKIPRQYQNKCIIIVWRIHSDGKLSMSKPCPNCQKYLSKKGVPMIYYSNDDGLFCRYYP